MPSAATGIPCASVDVAINSGVNSQEHRVGNDGQSYSNGHGENGIRMTSNNKVSVTESVPATALRQVGETSGKLPALRASHDHLPSPG